MALGKRRTADHEKDRPGHRSPRRRTVRRWVRGTRKVLGQTKRSPDEFAVFSRAPLSLPPDYGLRPPAPGAARQQEVEPRREARRIVLEATGRRPAERPLSGGLATASAGTQALLREAGVPDADPDIRAIVDRETSFLTVEDTSFTERLMFWGVETEYGTVVGRLEGGQAHSREPGFGASSYRRRDADHRAQAPCPARGTLRLIADRLVGSPTRLPQRRRTARRREKKGENGVRVNFSRKSTLTPFSPDPIFSTSPMKGRR